MRRMTRRDALAAAAGAVGAVASGKALSQEQANASVAIVTGIDPAFAPFVIGVRKGIFQKYGVQADLKSFDDGNIALDTLLTGSGDIAATNEVGGLVRLSRGARIFVMSSAHQSAQFYGILARPSVGKVSDLVGRNIGIVKGSGGHVFFDQLIRYYELDVSKMSIKLMQAPETIAALARGDVDAVSVWEPWQSRGIAAVPGARIIARGSDNDIWPLNGYIYFSKRLADDTGLGKRCIQAIIESSDWIASNWDESVKLTAEHYKLKPALADEIMKRFTWKVEFAASFKQSFVKAGQFARTAGLLTETPDTESFFRPEQLRAVAPSRVTV